MHLIPELGVSGAAISFSLSAFSLFLFQTAFFLHLSSVSIGMLVPGAGDVSSVWNFVVGKMGIGAAQ